MEAVAGVPDVFRLRNDGLRIVSCMGEVTFARVLAGTEEKRFYPKNTKSFGLYFKFQQRFSRTYPTYFPIVPLRIPDRRQYILLCQATSFDDS